MSSSLDECGRHRMRLQEASAKMSRFMPLSPQRYESLTSEEIAHIDQFLYRFAKLQDAMGQRLFKTLLLLLGEDIEDHSFIDIFNKLEKFGIVSNYERWLTLRTIRNELAHDYQDIPEENAERLNTIFELKNVLLQFLASIENYLQSKAHILNLQKK